MIGMGVKAKCKNCGKESPAEQFKLHYKLRMMVCPTCFSGKTQAEEAKKVARPPKPKGWDLEDEYLEKVSRLRNQEVKNQFSKIDNSDHLKCICTHCKYTFKYDPFKEVPKVCHYCNTDVPKFKNSYL